MGAGGWTFGYEIGLERRYRCRRLDLWGRNRAGTALWVLEGGPLAMKTGWNGAMGAGGCTIGAGIGLKRRYGCWQMDLWGRNRAGTEPRVPEGGPLGPESGWNGAMGAGRWTFRAGIGLERRQGCRRLYHWGRNRAGTALWVLEVIPLGDRNRPQTSVTLPAAGTPST